MNPKSLKKSPTWPFVGQFARLAMERQLSLHRDRGDRPGWMRASPDDLFQALLEQTQKASDVLMRIMMNPPAVPPEVKAQLLKHLGHIANFAMMVADCTGSLPEPSDDDRLLTALKAEKNSSLVGYLSVTPAMSILEEVRLAIGANSGESIDNSILRYTAAVRLGCARALELHAKKIEGQTPPACYSGPPIAQVVASWRWAAAFLREGLPEYGGEQNASQVMDAMSRWKAEYLESLKAGILESVFPQFWESAMGNLPSDAAKAKLEELLAKFEPVDLYAPLPLGPEGERIALEAAERRQDAEIERTGVTEDTLIQPAGPTQVQDEQPRPEDAGKDSALGVELDEDETLVIDDKGNGEILKDGDNNRPGVTDEGRAEGCLDSSCGDCDMK